MTAIQLKRTITGEYNARRYDLATDKEFVVAKDAVKSAGGKFDGDDKSWKVTDDIIKSLRDSGYTITEKSPYYQDAFVEGNIRDGGKTSAYVIGFRAAYENWPRMAGNLTVTFDTSDDLVTAEIERISTQVAALAKPPVSATAGQPVTQTYDRYYGVRALARKAANEAAAKVEARTLELLSATKRSKEEYIAVLKQVISEFGIRG